MWLLQLTHLYLRTRNTRYRQASIPPAGFEPAIPASERPQTDTLDCGATGDRQWMCWWWGKCSHHPPIPAWNTHWHIWSQHICYSTVRTVKECEVFGLNVLFLICVSMSRHSQGCAFRSNRRSSVPMKMAAKTPVARTAVMGVTWHSDTLLMSDSTLTTFSLSVLINPVRSMAYNLIYIYLFVIYIK
jgi:hypothetical protein